MTNFKAQSRITGVNIKLLSLPTYMVFLLITLVLRSCVTKPAFGQDDIEVSSPLEIPSSANPVGSGARAIGMGGAFIAIADDATAASWNPGGLIQLKKPEFSIVGTMTRRVEDNTFGTNPEADGKESIYKADLNYLSLAYPFPLLGRHMIVTLNYQNLFDFKREWQFTFFEETENRSKTSNFHYRQDGNLWALGLAYCIQPAPGLVPGLSFGVTLNFWEDFLYDNEWEQTVRVTDNVFSNISTTPSVSETFYRDHFSLSGSNANIGMFWDITDKFTLGAVLKTPFTADIDHEFNLHSFTPDQDPPTDTKTDTYDEEIDYPRSYGLGFAYRFSDAFTVSLDGTRTDWDDFVRTDSVGTRTSPISNRLKNESDVDETYQARMGAEYLLIYQKYTIPLRGGFFYDPAPAEDSPDDYYGFSLGSGIAYGRFVFDAAYQYRFGNHVGTSILDNLNFSQDLYEHMIYTSLIIHF